MYIGKHTQVYCSMFEHAAMYTRSSRTHTACVRTGVLYTGVYITNHYRQYININSSKM